jgi:hypothetical protein
VASARKVIGKLPEVFVGPAVWDVCGQVGVLRATALVGAAELARLDDVDTWGAEPFRIGLWVWTDVSPKRFDEADARPENRRVHVYCGDDLAECPFAEGRRPKVCRC